MSVTGDDGKLRILRVSSDLYPEVTGGLGLHVHHMSKRQAQKGHTVTVATSDHGDHDLPRRERRGGYTIRRHRELMDISGNSIIPELVKTVRDLNSSYDLIHAHSHLFFSTNVVAALRRLHETPLIITNHGVRSQQAPEWLQRIYLPTVARATLNAADCLLCYTETDRRRLRDLGVTSRVEVISNGVDCSRFKRLPVAQNGTQILYVGRLNEGKGVDVLLRAFGEIASTVPDARLIVVGDGPQREHLEEIVSNADVAEKVTFAGTVPNRQLPKLYNESAVLAIPSLNEGFPRTVIEAMACGTPVVTTDLPQLRSTVEDVGRCVPANDPAALADAIRDLLADEALREHLGETARRRAVRRHSWSDTVDRTTETFYSLVDRKSPEERQLLQ